MPPYSFAVSAVMRGHRLDEAQMIMLFPLLLSGAAQCWFASLDPSRRRIWADLGQEFIRQYSFNTIVDVSWRELEALRQRPDELVTSFISNWREKIAQSIDRPSERDQISMIMRSLQPVLPGISWASHRQTLDHWFKPSMALRRAYLEVYRQTLPFQTLRGRNQGQALDHQILALLVHRATDSHVRHRLIDSLQIFLTRHYSRISIDQLLYSGQQGLLIYICHHNQYMLHRRLRGHLYSTISSIEHRPHRGRLGSLHSSGCL